MCGGSNVDLRDLYDNFEIISPKIAKIYFGNISSVSNRNVVQNYCTSPRKANLDSNMFRNRSIFEIQSRFQTMFV